MYSNIMQERIRINEKTELVKMWFIHEGDNKILSGPFQLEETALDMIDNAVYNNPQYDLSDVSAAEWWCFPENLRPFCKADF